MTTSKNGKRNALIAIAILGALGVASYFLLKKPKISKADPSKSDMVNQILSSSGGQGDFNGLIGLSDEFIFAWYNAVKAKMPTFVVTGKTFDSVTGKQK